MRILYYITVRDAPEIAEEVYVLLSPGYTRITSMFFSILLILMLPVQIPAQTTDYVYSTFLNEDSVNTSAVAIASDDEGNAYITGITGSSAGNYFINGTHSDCFVKKISPEGELIYSFIFGGDDSTIPFDIVVDDLGCVYVCGGTLASNLPMVNAFDDSFYGGDRFDGFILKLNPAGDTILFSTYIGDVGHDRMIAIDIDEGFNIYVLGITDGGNLPMVNSWNDTFDDHGYMTTDAYLAKFSSNGSTLLYSTYYGGSDTEYPQDLVVGSDGAVVAVGTTWSTDLPLHNALNYTVGIGTSFIFKMNPNGIALDFSTYFGGSLGNLKSNAVVMNSIGDIIVVGDIDWGDLPVYRAIDSSYNGETDIVIYKMTGNGSTILYATYYGSNGYETASDVTIDEGENIYVTGYTESLTFPVKGPGDLTHNGGKDGFLLKINNEGNETIYCRLVGGIEDDSGKGISVSDENNVFLCGYSVSSDFPLFNAYNSTYNSGDNAFSMYVQYPDTTTASITPVTSTILDTTSTKPLDEMLSLMFTGIAFGVIICAIAIIQFRRKGTIQ